MAIVVCLQTSEACPFQGQCPVLSVPASEPLGIVLALGIETQSQIRSESRGVSQRWGNMTRMPTVSEPADEIMHEESVLSADKVEAHH